MAIAALAASTVVDTVSDNLATAASVLHPKEVFQSVELVDMAAMVDSVVTVASMVSHRVDYPLAKLVAMAASMAKAATEATMVFPGVASLSADPVVSVESKTLATDSAGAAMVFADRNPRCSANKFPATDHSRTRDHQFSMAFRDLVLNSVSKDPKVPLQWHTQALTTNPRQEVSDLFDLNWTTSSRDQVSSRFAQSSRTNALRLASLEVRQKHRDQRQDIQHLRFSKYTKDRTLIFTVHALRLRLLALDQTSVLLDLKLILVCMGHRLRTKEVHQELTLCPSNPTATLNPSGESLSESKSIHGC